MLYLLCKIYFKFNNSLIARHEDDFPISLSEISFNVSTLKQVRRVDRDSVGLRGCAMADHRGYSCKQIYQANWNQLLCVEEAEGGDFSCIYYTNLGCTSNLACGRNTSHRDDFLNAFRSTIGGLPRVVIRAHCVSGQTIFVLLAYT